MSSLSYLSFTELRLVTKGAIIARFTIDNSSICFINCHLAAGQKHIRERNADLAAILEDKAVFPPASLEDAPLTYVGGGDGSMILDHEICFVRYGPTPDTVPVLMFG